MLHRRIFKNTVSLAGPVNAKFLSSEEKVVAVDRPRLDSAGVTEQGKTKFKHIIQALCSPHTLGCGLGFFFGKSVPPSSTRRSSLTYFLAPAHNPSPSSPPPLSHQWATQAPRPNSSQSDPMCVSCSVIPSSSHSY